MKKPELLCPAGNLTKLKIALAYGADAVYASVGSFSLRQRSGKEFDAHTFAEGVELAHEKGAKFYATVNAFPFSGQIEPLKRHIKQMGELGVDALIVATPAVIKLARELAPNAAIHVSTQANIMNYLDAEIYAQMGASRIIAAREMRLKDACIKKKKNPNLEIEIFVHGSMCFAFSGRCLVSAVQSGRQSNRGNCANDCRFKYELYARGGESGTLFRLEEDPEEGTHIFNSKDLNLSAHIAEIMQSGAVDSLKIEGRTKSEYYVACTARAYRMAIDDALAGRFDALKYAAELATLKNRGFSDGYLVKRPFERTDTQNFETSLAEGTHQVHAISENGETMKVKGKIVKGALYEIVAPASATLTPAKSELGELVEEGGKKYVKFEKLVSASGREFDEVHSGNINEIKLPCALPEFSFLRSEI